MKTIGLTEFGGPEVLQVVDLPEPDTAALDALALPAALTAEDSSRSGPERRSDPPGR
jgi:hypothetical protein